MGEWKIMKLIVNIILGILEFFANLFSTCEGFSKFRKGKSGNVNYESVGNNPLPPPIVINVDNTKILDYLSKNASTETLEQEIKNIRKKLENDNPELAKKHFELAKKQFERRNYSQAQDNINKAINILDNKEKVLDPDEDLLANIYHLSAEIYYGLEEYEQAMENFVDKEKNHRRKNDYDHLANIDVGISRILCEQREYTDSLEKINSVLSNRKIKQQTIAKAYYQRGQIYLKQDKYCDAIKEFQIALKKCKKTQNQESLSQTALIYDALGLSHCMTGKYQSSQEFLSQALALKRQYLNTDIHSDLALTWHLFAILYVKVGAYDQAKDYAEKALQLQEGIWEKRCAEIAAIHCTLGDIATARFRLDDARNSYQKSLHIVTNSNGKRVHKDYPKYLFKLITIYILQKDYGRAMGEIDSAKQTISDFKDNVYYNALTPAYNGYIAFRQKSYDNSISLYGEAIKKLEEQKKDFSHEISLLNYRIGQVLQKQEKNPEALKKYQSSFNNLKQTFETDHLDIAKVCSSLASVYIEQSDMQNAGEYLNAAVTIQEKILKGERLPDVADTSMEMGNMKYQQKDYSGARREFNNALDIYNTTFGTNSIESSNAYLEIAKASREAGELNYALDCCRKSLNILKTSWLREKCKLEFPEEYDCYVQMGKISYNKKDYSNAIDYFTNAIDIYKFCGKEKPKVSTVYQYRAQAYFFMKNFLKSHGDFTTFSEYSNSTINAYEKIGDFYYQNDYWEDALEWYEKWEGLSRKKHTNVAEIGRYYFNLYQTKAEKLLGNGEFSEAIKEYKTCLTYCTRCFDNNCSGIHTINQRINEIEKANLPQNNAQLLK